MYWLSMEVDTDKRLLFILARIEANIVCFGLLHIEHLLALMFALTQNLSILYSNCLWNAIKLFILEVNTPTP